MNYNLTLHPNAKGRPDFAPLPDKNGKIKQLYVGDNIAFLPPDQHSPLLEDIKTYTDNETEVIIEMPEFKLMSLAFYKGAINLQQLNNLIYVSGYKTVCDFPYIKELLNRHNYRIISADIDNLSFCIRAVTN